jgi:hypothetical protein
MDAVVLTEIYCPIDIEELYKKLRVDKESHYAGRIEAMAAEAQLLAKPKAIYKNACIEAKGDCFVVIDGVKFTSHILRVNMEEVFQAVPFVVTCGSEIENWSKQFEDYLESFYADAIMEMVMRAAFREFELQVDQQYGLGHAVNMNPGSLADWPIQEQKPLFDLLGNVEDLIGVRLLDSCLMAPIKTLSGIRFPKEGTYENCQLCTRDKCPGRKATYDRELYEQKYQLKKQ